MTGNPMENPMVGIMYQKALFSLYSGTVNPIDREVLSMVPLPQDMVDPFASRDVDPREVMHFTYNALVSWVEEAKKASYFSDYFVKMSRLVMKGVITMTRGLVTLHDRGESPDHVPMSIGDLISLSSYHFRKSYLGVVQCAKSHPEISERLLQNQLTWCQASVDTTRRSFSELSDFHNRNCLAGTDAGSGYGKTCCPKKSGNLN